MKKIAVIGAGYVGLVTGACLAQKNNRVVVVEREIEKITSLLNGKVPFYEPGLDKLIVSAIKNKNLVFANSISQALEEEPEIIFSCVGTPSMPDGSADLSHVWNAAQEIGQHLSSYALVINKSTAPVGTTRAIKRIVAQQLEKRNAAIEFDVASNPEFLKEGDAVNDFMEPDRIIVGVENAKAAKILHELYYQFTNHHHSATVLTVTPESAELTKYAANAMLATRISFMNQMALLADRVGADIDDIKKGMALDKRIGSLFLNAGIGYGGSCFPKDVKALVHMGTEVGQPMTLVKEVDHVNDLQRAHFIDQIINYYNKNLTGKRIGIWGLAFKPETDDIRCAPALDVITKLLAKGARIIAYDPAANHNVKAIFKDGITLAKSADDVIKAADCLVILTDWREFLHYDFEKFTVLKDNVIFDGRNCYPAEKVQEFGITYFTVGRNLLNKHRPQTAPLDTIKKAKPATAAA